MIFSPGSFDPIICKLFIDTLSSAIGFSITYSQSQLETKKLVDTNEQLWHISHTDEMTQLLNRRGFINFGQHAINTAIAMKTYGCVLFGDMDGLKKINDTYGHDAGDRAIKAEASLLRQVFRVSDVIGRLGGDEFGIVAIGLLQNAIPQLRSRLDKVCKEWNETSGEVFKLSISLGAVEFYDDDNDLSTLLQKADDLQYQEKRSKKKDC